MEGSFFVPEIEHRRAQWKALEHFRAKWTPVRVEKMRRNKNLEPRSCSIGTEMALGAEKRRPNKGRLQEFNPGIGAISNAL
jgi:hypothetical protein